MHQYRQCNQLNEGLEGGDLARLVQPTLLIDEFKSKLGRDEDVCVIAVKVAGKEPAQDLVSFIEKGYPWVIDADVSSGELDDGDFLVFIECEREPTIPQNIVKLIDDLLNLTEQDISEWNFKYRQDKTKHELDEENLSSFIPLTPEDYKQRFGDGEIDKLKTAAGVKVDTKAPKNDLTESLRIAAGIR